jgi:ABC-type glutathione transport system ATPase component
VIVSHRLKLAAVADRVVVLQGGRVVEDGPPTRLLRAGGAFASLWREQNLRDPQPAARAWTRDQGAGLVAAADLPES